MSTGIDLSTPEALMRTFADRLNTGDLDGLVDLYEPDAVFEPQPGAVVHGHAAIHEAP
jgi:ketosteroid isomerase-like protein